MVTFDPACQTIKRGQIYKLFTSRAKVIDVLADVTDLEEWETRFAIATADPVSGPGWIQEWQGIGSTAEGEVTDVPIPFDQVFSFPGNKVITFRANDLTPANIAAAIAIRAKGSVPLKVWFQADDLIYGEEAGINGSMRADIIIPEGRDEPQSIQLTFTTRASLNGASTTPHPVL